MRQQGPPGSSADPPRRTIGPATARGWFPVMAATAFVPVAQFVVTALVIIGIVRIMKRKGIFTDEYQPVFDKLVTELAIPAVIFSIFASYRFTPGTIRPAAVLFAVLVSALVLAYVVCRLLRLAPGVTGTIVMISGFGSTATMGYPVLAELFSTQAEIVNEGFTIATVGVAFPFFTLGVIIASHFGSLAAGKDVRVRDTFRDFLATPIFISFVAGLAASFVLTRFQVPGAEGFIGVFTSFFTIIHLSLGLILWIAIGLMLRPVRLRFFLPLFALVAVIKLLFSPAVAMLFGGVAGFPAVTQQLLLLEAAVPSGALAAVLASRYGCDTTLAGWMVVGTYIACIVTIPFVFIMLPV